MSASRFRRPCRRRDFLWPQARAGVGDHAGAGAGVMLLDEPMPAWSRGHRPHRRTHQAGLGQPHGADGRAQSASRRPSLRHDHRADARPVLGGRLRDRVGKRGSQTSLSRVGMDEAGNAQLVVSGLQRGMANRISFTASISKCAPAKWSRCSAATRGQDDDAEIDHGHRRQAQGSAKFEGARRSASPPTRSPASRRHLSGRARHLPYLSVREN